MTFRMNRTLAGFIIVSGAITIFMGVVVLCWHLTKRIADYAAIIPLLSMGPVFALISCAVFLPQKLIWNGGIIQKYAFGYPTWTLDTQHQPLCIQARRIYTGKIYFRLVYRQAGETVKRDIQNYDNITKLYMQLLPCHNDLLFLENKSIFTTDVKESVVSAAEMGALDGKSKKRK
jgi:hypothetical protein